MNVFDKRVSEIQRNLDDLYERMAQAAERSGRAKEDIKLVAVTKMMPLETVRAGIEAGLNIFGENYAEQAAEKIIALKNEELVEWHMIGHIQSRKAETVCRHFDMVHSLDRLKIARHLNKNAGLLGKVMPVLIEVNLSGEQSKYGFEASDPSTWESLAAVFEEISCLENLEIRGLMTMPPFFDDPEKTRLIYRKLKRFQTYLMERIPNVSWQELSIGTSFDFEVAIEEGATMVRVGTEIFGSRSA